MGAQLLTAVHGAVVVEAVDTGEVHLRHLILGDPGPPQDPERQCHLLEAVGIGHGLRLTRAAGPEAHRPRDGEGADDTTMTMTDDVAPARIAMTATLAVEVVGVDREIEEVTVESMIQNALSYA